MQTTEFTLTRENAEEIARFIDEAHREDPNATVNGRRLGDGLPAPAWVLDGGELRVYAPGRRSLRDPFIDYRPGSYIAVIRHDREEVGA